MHICLFQSGVSYMRKLKAIVLAGILSVTCAFSVSAASGIIDVYGDEAYDSNGNMYWKDGDTTYSSDGRMYITDGDMTYGSDGRTYMRCGDMIYGSDGSSATIIDDMIYYDEPDDQDQDQDDVFPYLY